MIAHAGGVPLEEALLQLGPAAAAAAVALGVMIERARTWMRHLQPRNRKEP